MTDALTGGFSDAPIQSARAFRTLLDALSRPGKILEIQGAKPPSPLSTAAGTLLLTLADGTTPVHLAGPLDCAAIRDWVTFHTGAPLVSAAEATFALGTWVSLQPVTRFAIGTPEYPDRAATLIVEVPEIAGKGATLTGPGIKESARLSLPETATFAANHALFPLGFDCFFTAGSRVAALPRSTTVRDT